MVCELLGCAVAEARAAMRSYERTQLPLEDIVAFLDAHGGPPAVPEPAHQFGNVIAFPTSRSRR
jgi:hypothetical protein